MAADVNLRLLALAGDGLGGGNPVLHLFIPSKGILSHVNFLEQALIVIPTRIHPLAIDVCYSNRMQRHATHMESTRCKAVLLVDEAQEMTAQVLSELRLLSSSSFDSQSLLCIVMAGDARLTEKLRREELIPLGSRMRTRLATEFASRDELLACLEHLLAGAGNASLMTPSPISTASA